MSGARIWPERWDWLKVERTRVPMGRGEVVVVGPREMMVPTMSEQGTRGSGLVAVAWWL